MNNSSEIIPALMPERLSDIEERIALVPEARSVQLDIMDGVFVDTYSWPYSYKEGEEELAALVSGERTLPSTGSVRYEAHLMVSNPGEIGEKLARSGITTLIAHVESIANLEDWGKMVARWKEGGAKEIGLSLRTDTTPSVLEQYLSETSVVQFMGIEHIGYQGQSFSLETVGRVQEFHEEHPEMTVAVDGGVSTLTIPPLHEAGVSRFVVGSALFGADNPTEAFALLSAAVHSRS